MIIENTKISYFPASLMQTQREKIDEDTTKTAEQNGQTKSEYLLSIGYSNNDVYIEGIEKAAQRNIILVCAIEKIAEELEIKVQDADLEDYYSKIAKLYGMTERAVKAKYKNVDGIEAFLFQKKTYDKLFAFYK
jgi:FKBP-type peptidyl-prolyl cis-trans isomerase (trigger factor)